MKSDVWKQGKATWNRTKESEATCELSALKSASLMQQADAIYPAYEL